LIKNSDSEAYSQYEKEDKYKALVKKTYTSEKLNNVYLKGRNVSFCFKDGQNCLDGNKNQVHTRSLHAEENAMLQIAKYGGEGIKNGYLFTTASPCELCSKKAYQLGIEKIYFIDPYPGISDKQILRSGELRCQPVTQLFVGAVGRAYHQLFEPFMPYKDELKTILHFDYGESHLQLMKTDTTGKHIRKLENQIAELQEKLSKLKS
jgi:deoxycytidylate deaminase